MSFLQVFDRFWKGKESHKGSKTKSRLFSIDFANKRIRKAKKGLVEIDLEADFRNSYFGDNSDFYRKLEERILVLRTRADPSSALVRRLFEDLSTNTGVSKDRIPRPSPIERLARRNFVLRFPENIINEYVKSFDKQLKLSEEYKSMMSDEREEKDPEKKRNKKGARLVYLWIQRYTFEFGLRGEDFPFTDIREDVGDTLRKSWLLGESLMNEIDENGKGVTQRARTILDYRERRSVQYKTIKDWVDDFNANLAIAKDPRFKKMILELVLHFDDRWMEKNLDGSWMYGMRLKEDGVINKGYSRDFPKVDRYTHAVLSKMYGIFDLLFNPQQLWDKEVYNQVKQRENAIELYGERLVRLAETGNIRELYWEILQQVKASDYERQGVVYSRQEFTVSDFELFSFKGLSAGDKNKEAHRLAEYVRDSVEFCISDYKTARKYLDEGDIYVLRVDAMAKHGDKLVPKRIPEVAIHIKRDEKTGEEYINPNELHGNGENQGINPQFLKIAQEFVTQRKPDGSFRFTNAQEFEIKFADTIMYNDVKDKIEKLGKVDEEGKPYPDLEPNELKFLYQVHRCAVGFEISSGERMKIKVENLNELRLQKLGNKSVAYYEAKKELEKVDFDKMFTPFKNTVSNETEMRLCEVVVGGGPLSALKMYPKIVEMTEGVFTSSLEQTSFPDSVKKIGGVVLTDKDREMISKSKIREFPEENDPRRALVYL